MVSTSFFVCPGIQEKKNCKNTALFGEEANLNTRRLMAEGNKGRTWRVRGPETVGSKLRSGNSFMPEASQYIPSLK